MIKWIARFRISCACDRSALGENSASGAGTGDSELKVFAARVAELESRLHGRPQLAAPPAGLHSSIMAAVRAALPPPAPARTLAYRWATAGALAVLLCLGVWGGTRFLISSFAPSPFKLSSNLNQKVVALPSEALSPLSKEWESLNVDARRTADFLLSSIP